jgi:quinol monooxygenase YgiN
MGRVVISCYRPKPGHEDALSALMRTHVATLRSQGLVSARAPITMQAADGSYVEVFEWASAEAIQAAHNNPVVLRMWEQYGKVCDYIPVAQVPEASQLFADFTPVDVEA